MIFRLHTLLQVSWCHSDKWPWLLKGVRVDRGHIRLILFVSGEGGGLVNSLLPQGVWGLCSCGLWDQEAILHFWVSVKGSHSDQLLWHWSTAFQLGSGYFSLHNYNIREVKLHVVILNACLSGNWLWHLKYLYCFYSESKQIKFIKVPLKMQAQSRPI